MKERAIRRVVLLASIGMYILSLTQKCYCTTDVCNDSFAVALFGWFGFFLGGAGLTWAANPLLLLSWISIKRDPKISLILSALAMFISLSFLLFGSVIVNEAGHYDRIVAVKAGYWLWVFSSVVMLLGNVWLKRRNATLRT